MNQFFISSIQGSTAVLSDSESQHLRVLRMKEGDALLLVDGRGKQYSGNLTKLHKKAAQAEISSKLKYIPQSPILDIAIAPTKSNDRFEWFLEKATELGVRNIYPFVSYHSERKVIKLDRMEKIILSAMKQSLRLWLPQLLPIQTFSSLVKQEKQLPASRFIAHLKTDQLHFKDVIEPDQSTIILIGPEGGFSDQEIDLAEKQQFQSVTLGESRLRTETAGILAAALFGNS